MMPRSQLNAVLRSTLQPAHRRIAGLLPPTARRRYLYLAGHHRLPRLSDPRTFTEKVNWRILRDRRPELAWTCDKLAMKEYAARVQQEAGVAVPETLWSGDDLGAVAGRAFDRAWVLKPNHRSGLVRFGASSDVIDAATVAATRDWLRDDQSVLLGEWAYSQARHLFLVEEDIAGGGGPLDDYKFLVFHGEVAAVQVDRGRFTSNHTRSYYTPDWEHVPVQLVVPSGPPTAAPANLAAMLHAAEVLARPFDFMRVDLYSTGDAVWFGELTPYPSGGVMRYEPRSFDEWLGDRWSLPTSSDPAAGGQRALSVVPGAPGPR
ncbi:ATP-grasp fold amidoligase family protein [Blastococcus sp. VKM Ac-2987]|uniref:ATP-grasp fold amidoligase family protein n=1 Tax=Blastococcus sp. VKM Ac-2987 TaxID=3004141 RepID=UPI0022ABA72F|nr:ATP-grasp fold amidoligase family protein [Blastococcus sp. VKM Ac-2987]MCZ2860217.1 ATP-grasp fold amidoligase family protein [Blastococcus sp. VKM Ac-2987]